MMSCHVFAVVVGVDLGVVALLIGDRVVGLRLFRLGRRGTPVMATTSLLLASNRSSRRCWFRVGREKIVQQRRHELRILVRASLPALRLRSHDRGVKLRRAAMSEESSRK